MNKKIIRNIFLDFIIDFSNKWPASRDEKISLKDMIDFVDLWVEVNFKEYDDESLDDGSNFERIRFPEPPNEN